MNEQIQPGRPPDSGAAPQTLDVDATKQAHAAEESCTEGVCRPADLANAGAKPETAHADRDATASGATAAPARDAELIYVGDPMCSWCWGIAPELDRLRQHAATQGMGLEVILGGLRPGGGDAWTPRFRDFLRHEWQQVHARTGQPVSYDLLQRDQFNYDTEPACRAVVVARGMRDDGSAPGLDLYGFFKAVQHRFYADNADPSEGEFYRLPCEQLGLDADEFARRFPAPQAIEATRQDFALARQWGVNAFPTVLLRVGQQLYLLAQGYDSAQAMGQRVEAVLAR